MQHHGAPTRLLDWTLSPYVAAYFAAETDPDRDGAILAAHRQPLEAAAESSGTPSFILDRDAQMTSEHAPSTLRTYFPPRQTERFAAQQGVFIYSDNGLADHHTTFAALYQAPQTSHPEKYLLEKLLVPAELKTEFLVRLRLLNVSALTLFPGVDGLGRYTAETARTHSGY
jgi:hypothetical protein